MYARLSTTHGCSPSDQDACESVRIGYYHLQATVLGDFPVSIPSYPSLVMFDCHGGIDLQDGNGANNRYITNTLLTSTSISMLDEQSSASIVRWPLKAFQPCLQVQRNQQHRQHSTHRSTQCKQTKCMHLNEVQKCREYIYRHITEESVNEPKRITNRCTDIIRPLKLTHCKWPQHPCHQNHVIPDDGLRQ